jgi:hypothetical protein
MGFFSNLIAGRKRPEESRFPVAGGVRPPKMFGLPAIREQAARDVEIGLGDIPEHPGWMGRRPDLGEPVRPGEEPVTLEDAEDRLLSHSDVDLFLHGQMTLMVDSSNVASLRYEPLGIKGNGYYFDSNELIVEYLSGSVWAYQINHSMARLLAYAHSKGGWIWDYIRVRGEGNAHFHKVPAHEVASPDVPADLGSLRPGSE